MVQRRLGVLAEAPLRWESRLPFGGRAVYARRHIRVMWPYLTPRKLANIALNELEMRAARPRPRSVPPYIKIEATPLCHMKCPGCWHHSKAYKKTLDNNMHLTVARVARIVEPVSRDLVGVSLSFGGEPLLNRELPGIVAYLHGLDIGTSFPTNLSVPLSTEQAESFVRSGLDLMNVSLDGASEETYRQYRIGGRYPLVLENVRQLADAKRRLGASRPLLIWKMVVFPHNAHEVQLVRDTHGSLGFDGYELVPDKDSRDHVDVEKAQRKMIAQRKPCFHPWNTTVIGWDGSVEPCCKQLNSIKLGDAADAGLLSVWRSDRYAALRAGFDRKGYGDKMHPVCRRCIGLDR